MAEAVTNRSNLFYKKETVFNETPATPTLIELPFTGENLKHNKQTDTSAEIRDDRNVEDLAEIGVDTNGNINVEMQMKCYDALFESAFASAFVTGTKAIAATANLVAATSTITLSSGSFTAAEQAARVVKITGFTNPLNNGIKTVLSCTTTVMTFLAGSFVADQTGASPSIKYNYIRNGSTLVSLLLEKKFTDIAQFISFRGQVVNGFNLELTAKQKITGSFAFMGVKGVPASATVGNGAPTAKTDEPILRAGPNVGAILTDGVALTTGIRSLSLSTSNNFRGRDVVTSKEFRSMGFGNFDVTGKAEAYFEDLVLLQKYYNHTALALHLTMIDDTALAGMGLYLPKIKFTEGDPEISGQNEDIMLPLSFRALANTAAAGAYTAQLDYVY